MTTLFSQLLFTRISLRYTFTLVILQAITKSEIFRAIFFVLSCFDAFILIIKSL